MYANAVQINGAPLPNCFGFVDGTVRPISRPGKNQRMVYNGHRRVHSLKFPSLALTNGLIGHMYGPVGMLSLTMLLYIKNKLLQIWKTNFVCLIKFLEGKRHDSGIFDDSNLLQGLEAHTYSTTGKVLSIYDVCSFSKFTHMPIWEHVCKIFWPNQLLYGFCVWMAWSKHAGKLRELKKASETRAEGEWFCTLFLNRATFVL